MIVYKSNPGGWATIDHPYVSMPSPQNTLTVDGDHVRFEQLGITNSDATRYVADAGGNYRGTGVALEGTGGGLRNCILTDTGDGVDSFGPNAASEMYGNLILDCGWLGTDRGHGHCIYTQHAHAPLARKIIKHNVMSGAYATGCKTAGAAGEVSSYEVDENIVCFSADRTADVTETAGFQHYSEHVVSQDMWWRRNIAFQEEDHAWISWFQADDPHVDCHLIDNWLFGGNGINFTNPWTDIEVTGCVVRAGSDRYLFKEDEVAPTTRTYENIAFYGGKALAFNVGGIDMNFASWVTATGATGCTFSAGEPPARTWVWPNDYEDKRALITVWNPTSAATVNVDADTVFDLGDEWYLFNSLNPYAAPVASGVYDGSITVPMTGIVNRTPVGADPVAHDPRFASFTARGVATWVAP